MELKNRKVTQFRCHLDPAIPPKPRNSFDKRELPLWEMELLPIGVYVKARYQAPGTKEVISEHIVPFSNIQSIKLEPLPENTKD